MVYQFSNHSIEQMKFRSIDMKIVDCVLDKPDQKTFVDDLTVFQSIIREENGKVYLIRVFINEERIPNLIVTVYKTSKIQKYYEG
ncbi:MAG: DUF4258 domain-containing protein [Bacteroidetes bacterium]|nr:DUF4258 domain-containing protein [Bacteroidota bacterium]